VLIHASGEIESPSSSSRAFSLIKINILFIMILEKLKMLKKKIDFKMLFQHLDVGREIIKESIHAQERKIIIWNFFLKKVAFAAFLIKLKNHYSFLLIV